MTLRPLPERDAWLALAAVDGIGEHLLARLVARFGSAMGVLSVAASPPGEHALRLLCDAAPGHLRPRVAARIRATALDPGALSRQLDGLGAWAVTPLDAAYPDRLRELDPPPAALFGRGSLEVARDPRAVAVVGTRRPTPGGRALAAAIGRRLAEARVAVVSGLAVGIDGAAHAAAIEAGGSTTAVIGGGLLHAGPRAHARLSAAILERGGAILGEHAPAVPPSRGTFPRRNRIISGLAVGTIVVEAPERSGALITARLALEQGRRLLVVPGRPGEPASAGCLALLRDSPARPFVGLDEMLADLHLDRPGPIPGPAAPPASRSAPGGRPTPDAPPGAPLWILGPVERAVAERLRMGPASSDALIAATGLPAPVVAGAVTLLQLRGWSRPFGALHLPAGPLLVPARVARRAARGQHDARGT